MITYLACGRENQRDLQVFANIIERPNMHTLIKLLKLGFPIAVALCCEVALFALTSFILIAFGGRTWWRAIKLH